MLRAMHLIVNAVEAPFEPENGAYATGGHAQHHGHEHHAQEAHGHGHGHTHAPGHDEHGHDDHGDGHQHGPDCDHSHKH